MAETGTSIEETTAAKSRRQRKEEGRLRKRQRIEASGGVRPRNKEKKDNQNDQDRSSSNNNTKRKGRHNKRNKTTTKTMQWQGQHQHQHQHRFGQVMNRVPCPNKPRFSTRSVAVPGSVLSNCQTRELRTHLVGQIARACTLYHVDEVVVFDDKLAKGGGNHHHHHNDDDDDTTTTTTKDPSCSFLARVLQYCECPQYLRRNFFPTNTDLQFAGLLPPIDAPHHVRADDRCKYREGVVLKPKQQQQQQQQQKDAKSSLVYCGVRNRPIVIDRFLPVGIRCTVQVDPKDYGKPGKKLTGKVVSPSTPREDDGTYWGFTTRIADSIHKVFDECPFEGGYDLKIGTSERGDINVEDPKFALPKFKHSLIVFGGVAGIEECVDADETSKLPGSESKQLFDLWVNMCPFQGSRTIRTEEAVLISLAKLSPHLSANGTTKETDADAKATTEKERDVVDFTHEAISEESSDDSSSSSSESE